MTTFPAGVVAGLVGTSAMTATLFADRFAGGMEGELPPRKVARRAEESIGVRDDLSRPAFEASWLAQHFAYGTAAGLAYELAWHRLRLPEPLPSGPAYGLALWAIGYSGWLPLMGLYPPPNRDSSRRVAGMIAHHLVYGTVVAMTASFLRHQRR
ncbi:MAG: hypothetical protein U0790_08455 [Isosphaeraceae bacterium]